MTTRSRQKLSSILAVFSIIVLLLLLVFLWTAGRNGVFSNSNDMKAHGSYRLRPIHPGDSIASTTTQTSNDVQHSLKHHSHEHHSHHQHHRHNESTPFLGKFCSADIFIIFAFAWSKYQSCFTLAFVYSSGYFVLFLSIPWALWIPQMSCTCTAHAISIQCNKFNALNSITMKIRRFGFEAFQSGISSSYTCLSWIIYIFSNWLHTIDA